MKVRLFTTVILLITVCAILCGCFIASAAPLGSVEVENQQSEPKVKIYICGAVEREGYYETTVGVAYVELLSRAGILPQSVLPKLSSSYVDGSIGIVVVGYNDGAYHDSINANSPVIVRRMHVEGLTDEVVNKLADYIEIHGKIANKIQLKQALGNHYADNYYKLFVAEIDYEETD